MTPRRSFLGRFTRKGRLRNGWAAALREPDSSAASERLRQVLVRVAGRPASFADLWLPFLDSMLDARLRGLLTEEDFGRLEEIGTMMARESGEVALERAWLPLVAARHARQEQPAALALLTRLYWASPPGGQARAEAARQLAAQDVHGDDHLTLYVNWLRSSHEPAWDPAIVRLLSDALAVGFGVPSEQLGRAGALAERLREAQVAFPGVELALGYARLLADEDPTTAARHLETALAASPDDRVALVGLLAASVRGGDYGRVLSATQAARRPASPEIEELVTLGAVLSWLDDPMAPGGSPATAARLEEFSIAEHAGDWLPYALGRLHLIEGNVQAAAQLLVSAAEKHPEQPRWGYHAAWALLLLGDRQGVERLYRQASSWPGRWTIGCLLMDADPALATTVGVAAGLEDLPAPYRQVAKVRTQLPGWRRPSAPPAGRSRGRTVEEEMEVLRTVLGAQFSDGDTAAMDRTLARSVFQRLPSAERLVWSGLRQLPADPDRGRELLRQAHASGYTRASLLLAAHHLEEGRFDDASGLLEPLSWRRDAKLRLLRAVAEMRRDSEERAVARMEQLAVDGEPRAYYTLGDLHLRQAGGHQAAGRTDEAARAYERAAAAFRAAAAEGPSRVPDDAGVLAACADMAREQTAETVAACAGHWPEVRGWAGSRERSWVSWMVALAQLAHDPANADLDACDRLIRCLESAPSHPAAARVVVAGLARASLAAEEPDRAEALAGRIGRVRRTASPANAARLHEIAAAAAARRRGRAQPGEGRTHLDGLVRDGTGSAAPAVVAAQFLLERGHREGAARLLHATRSAHELERWACQLMADLLDRSPPPAERLAPPPLEAAPEVAPALALILAAGLAETAPRGCVSLLIEVAQHLDIATAVDVRAVLPALCRKVARARVPPQPLVALVRRMVESAPAGTDPLLLARCATAVGELDLAARVWAQVPAAGGPAGPVAAEHLRFLCHRVVVARRRGDHPGAADLLRQAARVAARRPDGEHRNAEHANGPGSRR